MKRTITIFFLLFLSFNAFAQKTLTIDKCYLSARLNYPTLKQKPFNDSLSGYKLNNYDIGYLPKISFGAQVSYQSDVTKLNINVPFINMPDINKDRYQITMGVNQLIYDGGNINSFKDIEKNSLQVDQQKIEVELYALKQRVNDFYFNVLILKEKRKSLDITASDISDRITEQESQIKGGAIAEGNIYILKAQLLQVKSQMTEAYNDILAAINSLSELIGEAIQPDAEFKVPENKNISIEKLNYNGRPENHLYDLQKNYLTSLKENLHSSKNPKLSAFGQAGYGRPGLNMLDNSFQPFYIVGLNISWSPVDWGSESLQSQIYNVNCSIVDIQRETFHKNLTVTGQRYKSDIEKYSVLLDKDDEILSIRQEIMKVTKSQLDNGIITATNYITELNNYNQAMLTKNIHRLQLIQSKINFLTNQGY